MSETPALGQVTIVGVGLLGGSLGLALRRRGLAERVVGHGRSPERLAQARAAGAIDAATQDLSEACAHADLIVLCTPVMHIVDALPAIVRAARPGTMITDVGSTKERVIEAAREVLDRDIHFVGSHPMAGSDRTGVEHARADLYEGATTFVTVEEGTPMGRAAELCRLWRAVGARAVLIHPRRHDRLVAAISHLPHLLAVGAVQSVADVHEDENFLRAVIGNGFRDTTRVAQGSTEMWRDICTTNPVAIVEAIDTFTSKMADMRERIARGDTHALADTLEAARTFRAGLTLED